MMYKKCELREKKVSYFNTCRKPLVQIISKNKKLPKGKDNYAVVTQNFFQNWWTLNPNKFWIKRNFIFVDCFTWTVFKTWTVPWFYSSEWQNIPVAWVDLRELAYQIPSHPLGHFHFPAKSLHPFHLPQA